MYEIDSTAIITDIRNFSQTFKNCQNANSSDFLEFLESYYESQKVLADVLSDDYHMSLIGDGILAVFMGDNNHRNGYAYVLASHRIINKLCDNFYSEFSSEKISFGMGADSGTVYSLGYDNLSTYVGTVINRAARIEQLTKGMAKTTTAVGNSLYKKLIKDFHPEINEVMKPYTSYDELLSDNHSIVMVSEHYMLRYAMDMPLKGVQKDAPIFRMVNDLVSNDEAYWGLMGELLSDEKIKKLKKLKKLI